MPLDVGDLLIIGAGVAFVLRWPSARNRRAVLVLVALASIYVLAAIALSGPPEGIVKIGVVWAYVLIVLGRPAWLGMLSASDARIDRTLRSVFGPVNAALDGWRRDPGPSTWTTTAEACEAALDRLETLPPLDRRWQATIALTRRYITTVRDAARAFDASAPTRLPPEVSGPAFTTLVKAIDESWRKALGQPREIAQ